MKILGVGDTHHGYVHPDNMSRALEIADREQPAIIFQMGDLYDLYNMSRYPRSLNLVTPLDELIEARAAAEAMWVGFRMASPKSRLIQLWGNHDDRLSKLVATKAPELEAFLQIMDYKSFWRFEGVETAESSDVEVIVEHPVHGDIWFHHGHKTKIGEHADYNLANTVTGHLHRGGTIFRGFRDRTLWELNTGYLADQRQRPMQYNAQQNSNTTPGVGLIDNDGPRFIPFPRPITKTIRIVA
jgi:hypothetical protein